MSNDLREAAALARARAVELRDCTDSLLGESLRLVRQVEAGSLGRNKVAELTARVEDLRSAMESRAAIEQAKGVIIASTGCDEDAAFALLVQESQHTNRKLRDVARELVASKIQPATDPAHR